MSKKYNNLWVFGDSYTTPDVCVQPYDSFWGITAEYCNIPTITNCSRPSNSFDSVCQLLIGMQDSYDWKQDLFLIGIPPLERITVFDEFKSIPYHGHKINTEFWSINEFQISAHHGLVSLQNYGSDKQLVIHSDRSWVETQALRTIFLLTSWLDAKNANYMIINLAKSLDSACDWLPSEFLLPYVKKHQRCIVFEDGYRGINVNKHKPADYDKFGWNGHHGPDGNRYFFEESLLPRLQHCKLV